jgi:hypothetical protein
MRVLIFLIGIILPCSLIGQDLKEFNYLLINKKCNKIQTLNIESLEAKNFSIPHKSDFSPDGLLTFYYNNKINSKWYKGYQEFDVIPQNWNKINSNQLIKYLERTKNLKYWENRLFFVLKDKKTKTFKVYQVINKINNLNTNDDENY